MMLSRFDKQVPEITVIANVRDGSNEQPVQIAFDSTISEGATFTSSSTDYPVETGAVSQDHITNKPVMLAMQIIISQSRTSTYEFANSTGSDMMDDLRDSAVNAGGSIGLSALGSQFEQVSALVSLGASGLKKYKTSSTSRDRCAELLDTLTDLYKKKAIFNVKQSLKSYNNVHIVNMSYMRAEDAENALTIDLELKQLQTTSRPRNKLGACFLSCL